MTPLISIILVEPENPDNIGAAARAMKNMGLSDLRCVKPPKQWKTKGRKLAMSAGDVLRKAKSFASAAQAVADCGWVLGTTRRKGPRRGTFIAFERTIENIKKKSQKTKVAILFGKESKGLDNDSLKLCDNVVTIPSHEAYPSLNLAQAVMVICFSLFDKDEPSEAIKQTEPFCCTKLEIEETFRHFEKALTALNYGKERNNLRERILSVFAGIFKRSGMLEVEAQMIKGLSARISQKVISCNSRQ